MSNTYATQLTKLLTPVSKLKTDPIQGKKNPLLGITWSEEQVLANQQHKE